MIAEDAIEKALDELESGKVLHRDLLEALWTPLGISKCYFPLVLGLLREFGLAYEVTTQSGCCGYLFPWLLQSQVTENLITTPPSKHITVRYNFVHYMPGFFEHFLTRSYPLIEFGEISRYGQETSSVHKLVTRVSANVDSISVRLVGTQNRCAGDTHCSEDIEVFCSGSSDIEAYDQVWKVVLQLTGTLEIVLKGMRKDVPERSVLCPSCVDDHCEKPKLFPFQVHPMDPSHQKLKCSKCTQRNGRTTMIAVKKLIPKQSKHMQPINLLHCISV